MMMKLVGPNPVFWGTTVPNLEGLLIGNLYDVVGGRSWFMGEDGRKRTIDAWLWDEPKTGTVVEELPTMRLSNESDVRKNMPIFSGVLNYFPLAIAEVSKLSKIGNDKHNPGQPLHWSKGKSTDHKDCIARHLIDAGTIDPDSQLFHDVGLAWRALANLETLLESQNDTQK